MTAIARLCWSQEKMRPSWSWWYGSWIYKYLCNQYLSPLTLLVRTLLGWGILDTMLCDKVCQWLATGWWFSPDNPVSSTNKTDRHNIAEILLKVALNPINPSFEYKCHGKIVLRPRKNTNVSTDILEKKTG